MGNKLSLTARSNSLNPWQHYTSWFHLLKNYGNCGSNVWSMIIPHIEVRQRHNIHDNLRMSHWSWFCLKLGPQCQTIKPSGVNECIYFLFCFMCVCILCTLNNTLKAATYANWDSSPYDKLILLQCMLMLLWLKHLCFQRHGYKPQVQLDWFVEAHVRRCLQFTLSAWKSCQKY